MVWRALVRVWRWVTGYEPPPDDQHERLMRKFSRTPPSNEGRTPLA